MIYLTAGSHPVEVVQYTYTQKQFRERNKTNNKQNNTKIYKTTQAIHRKTQKLGRILAVPRLCAFTLAFVLQLRKKDGKSSVRIAIHKHTIRIYSHNNKNT
jgi:hypothetical protein